MASILLPMEEPGAAQPPLFVAKWAAKLGVKQRDIVEKTGMGKGYISRIWNREKYPGPDKLSQIAAAIGVPPGALLYDPDSHGGRLLLAELGIQESRKDFAVEMIEGMSKRR